MYIKPILDKVKLEQNYLIVVLLHLYLPLHKLKLLLPLHFAVYDPIPEKPKLYLLVVLLAAAPASAAA